MKKLITLLFLLSLLGLGNVFAQTPAIGDNFQGGIVFYILQPGDPGYVAGQTSGFIAAPYDQSAGIQWLNGMWTPLTGTTPPLGMGKANTDAIIAVQGVGNYAASLCHDLVLGGYNDWYLPSQDELNKLYLNRALVGGFHIAYYWSSTEYGWFGAFGQSFLDGSQFYMYKDYAGGYVRAIRSFTLPPAVTIPTLSQWGLIIFAGLLLAVGVVFVVRRQKQLAGS